MKKKFTLGVIGGGFMATSIIDGVIDSKVLSAKDICVSDLSDKSIQTFNQKGVCAVKDNMFVASNSEYLLFAVKPQNLSDVLVSIKGCGCEKLISIMAGVKKRRIYDVFSNSIVARAMPNTPCSIGKGAVGLDVEDFKDESDKQFVISLFDSIANVVLLSEDKMNVVTAVSGSSPAYFYLFVKGVIEAGVKNGLTLDESKSLAVNTMIGAGEMLKINNTKSIDELIDAVCSKGGTTIEAISVYNENNLSNITNKAVEACINRAKQLEEL